MASARPFLKWAGGKHRIVSELLKIIDDDPPLRCQWKVGAGSRYHEPFLGSGAMFFGLKSNGIIATNHQSYLSDVNPALINALQVVSEEEQLDDLVKVLRNLQEDYGNRGTVRKHATQEERNAGMYYEMRARMNTLLADTKNIEKHNPVDFAALMIFLNKTCFNGLWRVNSEGLFNVPEGDYVKPRNICQEGILRECQRLLNRTKIESLGWKQAMSRKRVKEGDLVYLDPPYMPLKIGDNVFTSYFTKGFDFGDQRELAQVAASAAAKGVRVVASNHDTKGEPTVREIYNNAATDKGCKIEIIPIQVGRNISCKGHGRVKVNEVLIFMGPE